MPCAQVAGRAGAGWVRRGGTDRGSPRGGAATRRIQAAAPCLTGPAREGGGGSRLTACAANQRAASP